VKEHRLDEFSELDRIDFVKIDAEGMEPDVWQSLGEKRPEAALIEWTPRKYKDAAGFLNTILYWGYRIGRVNQHGDVDPVGKMGDDVSALLAEPGWQALWLERSA
jgi:hypothetical protein